MCETCFSKDTPEGHDSLSLAQTVSFNLLHHHLYTERKLGYRNRSYNMPRTQFEPTWSQLTAAITIFI